MRVWCAQIIACGVISCHFDVTWGRSTVPCGLASGNVVNERSHGMPKGIHLYALSLYCKLTITCRFPDPLPHTHWIPCCPFQGWHTHMICPLLVVNLHGPTNALLLFWGCTPMPVSCCTAVDPALIAMQTIVSVSQPESQYSMVTVRPLFFILSWRPLHDQDMCV